MASANVVQRHLKWFSFCAESALAYVPHHSLCRRVSPTVLNAPTSCSASLRASGAESMVAIPRSRRCAAFTDADGTAERLSPATATKAPYSFRPTSRTWWRRTQVNGG